MPTTPTTFAERARPVPDCLIGLDLIVSWNVALGIKVAVVVCTQSTRFIFSLLCVCQFFCLVESPEVEILFLLNLGCRIECFFASHLP